MLNKFRRHLFRTWKHHATMQLATLAVLVGTYTVVSSFAMIHQNMDALLSRWGETVKLSVYLDDKATDAEKSVVDTYIKSHESFKSYEFINKNKAMTRFQTQMGSFLPDLIFDENFKNPLPESYEVELKDTANAKSNYSVLVSIAEEISKLIAVNDVSYGQGWVENYASLVGGFSATSFAFVLLLLFGSLFVVGNSIRSSVSQRRAEIEVLELVGATNWHIKSPFIFEGALMGFISAAISLVIVFLVFSWQQTLATEDLSYWTMGLNFSFLTWARVLTILVIGTFIGAIGSYICVRKLNSGWLAAEGAQSQ